MSIDAYCGGCADLINRVYVTTSASIDLSTELVISGAGDGQGYVTIGFYMNGGSEFGDPEIHMNVFGGELDLPSYDYPRGRVGQMTVPVQFGVPYDISIWGEANCTSELEGSCSALQANVTGLTFSDAEGNPLPGAFLAYAPAPVPEPAAWWLLASVMFGCLAIRRERSKS